MPMKVNYPSKNEFVSQGTIFTGARAENYNDTKVLGIFITARCDFAHDKVRTYSYVPLVPIKSWFEVDFKYILAKDVMADSISRMKSSIIEIGESPSILDTTDPIVVYKKLFIGTETTIKKKIVDKMKSAICKYIVISRIINSKPPEPGTDRLVTANPSAARDIIRRLNCNNLSGYYLFTHIEPNSKEDYHIALLRNISTLPREIAMGIACGMDKPECLRICEKLHSISVPLDYANTDIAYPVGQLISPHIEHFVQTLTLLFYRIGVSDNPENTVDKISTFLPGT